jgi:hypothetical protein
MGIACSTIGFRRSTFCEFREREKKRERERERKKEREREKERDEFYFLI